MLSKATGGTTAVPSRNAIRILRHLAFAGSTVGGFCAVAGLTYDVHLQVRVAQQIIENKRTLHSCAPYYNATSAAKRLEVMYEAAEAGEFMGLESLKNRKQNLPEGQVSEIENEPETQHTDVNAESHNHQIQLDPLGHLKPPPGILHVFEPINRAKTGVTRKISSSRVDDKIRALLRNDREIEAAFVFLNQIPLRSRAVDASLLEMARHLFVANAMKGNVFVARNIYRRIDEVGGMTPEMWATMMHLLAKEGHIDSAGEVYDTYRTVFDVPPYLTEVVLRCLIESKRLTSAKWMFFRNIKHDRDCGLSGAYLDGLWRKTRSIELLQPEFETLLWTLRELNLSPNEKLFNPVIRANIEIGRFEAANALVEDMPKYGAQPGCRAYGLLLYGQALQCNWDGVMAGLREMHEKGFTLDKRDFPIVLDRLFLEFWPAHSAEKIVDFITTCVNEFAFEPDKILYEHILEALVQRGTKEHIEQISRMARECQWKASVSEGEFLKILRLRLQAMQDAPIGVWRTLQAMRQGNEHTAMSRRLLGIDSVSWRGEREKLWPIHDGADASYRHSLNSLASKKPMRSFKQPSMYIPLHKRMEHFIHGGHYKRAIEAFETAKYRGFYMYPIHIKLNAIAMMLESPQDASHAKEMIRTEWGNYWATKIEAQRNTGKPRKHYPLFPLLFHRIFQVSHDEALLQKMIIFEFMRTCEDARDLNLKSHLVVGHSRLLIQTHMPRIAIDILTAYYMSRWRFSLGFDGVFLKMLIRAFAEVGNAQGVRWCMLAALSRKEVRGFQDFIAECRAIMPLLEMRLPTSTLSSERSQQMSMLEEFIEVMKCKMAGDQYWLSFHVDPKRKQRLRSSAKSIVYQTNKVKDVFLASSTEDTIANFDEEREMEYLLGRRQLKPNEVAWVWAEQRIHYQQYYPMLSEDPRYPLEPEEPSNRMPVYW